MSIEEAILAVFRGDPAKPAPKNRKSVNAVYEIGSDNRIFLPGQEEQKRQLFARLNEGLLFTSIIDNDFFYRGEF